MMMECWCDDESDNYVVWVDDDDNGIAIDMFKVHTLCGCVYK